MNSSFPLTYKQAGVDIDTGNDFVKKIRPFLKKTERPELLSTLGGFAALFQLDLSKHPNPVLVSTTDGVGTKVKLAVELKQYKGLGQDLVAMCVNDLVCTGAEPIFFLDYLASGRLDLGVATDVIEGMTNALAPIRCALVGGETAEMPGLYQNEEFDLAGFAVGVISRDKIVDGSTIVPGDAVIALGSSGPHSNGYSLIRKILNDNQLKLDQVYPGLDRSLGELLIEPTRIYVTSVLRLAEQFKIKGIAHITGGGLIENPPRILPPLCRVVFKKDSWEFPAIFRFLQNEAHLADEEMLRVFNCGVGMILVVAVAELKPVLQILRTAGEKAWQIGEIEQCSEEAERVCFV